MQEGKLLVRWDSSDKLTDGERSPYTESSLGRGRPHWIILLSDVYQSDYKLALLHALTEGPKVA